MLVTLGFEKKIIFNQKAIEPHQEKTIKVQQSIQNNSLDRKIETNLINPRMVSNYAFKLSEVTPTFNHWAIDELKTLTALGIIPSDWTTNQSLVKQPLNKIQMTRAIVLTDTLASLPQENSSTFNFSLVELPGIPHTVSLKIKNQDNQVVANIVKDKTFFTGNHNVFWNGLSDKQKAIRSGDYMVELLVFDQEYIIGSKKQPLKILSNHDIPKPNDKLFITVNDVTDTNDLQLIQKWISLDNKINAIPSKNNEGIFEPLTNVSRIDFILNVAELLTKHGARNLVKADLSPYKDLDNLNLSQTQIEKLELYIGSLGYGGDNNHKLRPNDTITLSETSVILGRFLKWLETNKNLTIQFI